MREGTEPLPYVGLEPAGAAPALLEAGLEPPGAARVRPGPTVSLRTVVPALNSPPPPS